MIGTGSAGGCLELPASPAPAAGEAGRVHSVTTGSMVDGPGVRAVVWTAGCLMRCGYCHNPDTWSGRSGATRTARDVVAELARSAAFLRAAGGGVTVTGGEPLLQAPFALRILRGCRALGLHTALDTNGWLGARVDDEELEAADLVLLDLKAFDPGTHRRLTGVEVEPVLRFARRLSDLGRPAWIRFVLVPGHNDAPDEVEALASFVATLRNVERVEVLPFHQMGRSKWERLGRAYPMAEVEPPSPGAVAAVKEVFRAYGTPVV